MNKAKRFLAIVLCAVMTIPLLLAGCGKKNTDGSEDGALTGEKVTNVYRSSGNIAVPDGMNVNFYNTSAVVSDGRLAMYCYSTGESDADGNREVKQYIFSVGTDGVSDPKTTEIIGDFDGYYVSMLQPLADGGCVAVMQKERSSSADPVGYIVSRMDKDGKEIYRVDPQPLFPEVTTSSDRFMGMMNEDFYMQYLAVSKDGTVALGTSTGVVLLSPEGKKTGAASFDNQLRTLGFSGGGKLFCAYYDSKYKTVLAEINTENCIVGSALETPASVGGNGNYDYYFGDGYDIYVKTDTALLAWNVGDTDTTTVINWVNSDIPATYVRSLTPIDADNIFICINDYTDGSSEYGVFKHIPDDQVEAKILIHVTYIETGMNSIPLAAIKFNRKSEKYRVVCDNYSDTNTDGDYQAMNTRLDADVLAGKVGDIVVVSSVDKYLAYAKNGALRDLYAYMDKDAEYSRDKFFACTETQFEVGGKLYALIPSFYISTMAAKASLVGDKSSWTLDEAVAYIKSMPAGTSLMKAQTRDNMLNFLLAMGFDSFVDKETGKCSFDSQRFIEVLKLAGTFPEKVENEDYDDITGYQNGTVILKDIYMWDFASYLMDTVVSFGENEKVSLVGYPCDSGVGGVLQPQSMYCVTSASKNPDGAWEFIRTLVAADSVSDSMRGMRAFPSLISAFDQCAEDEKKFYYDFNMDGHGYGTSDEPWTEETKRENRIYTQLTDETVAFIKNYIGTLNVPLSGISMLDETLRSMITEETAIYFSGAKTAEETAKIIQDRVSKYINESR